MLDVKLYLRINYKRFFPDIFHGQTHQKTLGDAGFHGHKEIQRSK